MTADNYVEVHNLVKYFDSINGVVHAVDGVDFAIKSGETLGLVGESGCGKSTIGRVLVKLIEPTSGEVIIGGKNTVNLSPSELLDFRKNVQIIFQDPYSSLDPRLSVFDLIAEPLRIFHNEYGKEKLTNIVTGLMDQVGLAKRVINFYPHELDGGRRQRIGVARALALSPRFIILDEPVSALDVSIQAQIINLLIELQADLNLTYLFISHDLSVVKYMSDDVAVMYLGEIIETADSKEIFDDPVHPYTKALLSAVPIPRLDIEQENFRLEGEVPSAIQPPEGCRFRGRCPYAIDACMNYEHNLSEVNSTHKVACLRYKEFL